MVSCMGGFFFLKALLSHPRHDRPRMCMAKRIAEHWGLTLAFCRGNLRTLIFELGEPEKQRWAAEIEVCHL